MNLSKKLITFIIIACLLEFGCGYIVGSHPIRPQAVTILETHYIDREVIIPTSPTIVTKTINTLTIKEVPVDKVVYQNIYSRRWESVEQFENWYQAQNFTILLPNGGDLDTADCDDYALWLAEKALEQGYLVSVCLVDDRGVVYGVYVHEAYHMGCLVVIGNGIYYVESDPMEHKVIKICDKD